MYSLSEGEFSALAADYNLVPIYREIVADIDTPVSAFLKLGNGHNSFLLESVEGGETLGRYSFMGANPFLVASCTNGQVRVTGEKQFVRDTEDPLTIIGELLAEYRPAPVPGLPPFAGGAVGYVGYDAVRYFERIPKSGARDLDLPELLFIFTDVLVTFDHLRHRIQVLVNARIDDEPGAVYRQAIERIEEVIERLSRPTVARPIVERPDVVLDDAQANFSKEEFVDAVKAAKDYVYAGDILQVVLSQRFSIPIDIEPFDIYRILRTINPSPYLGYLKFDDMALVASSPEPLVKVEGRKVITRPIAGTRRRGVDSDEDRALESELLADEKEKAEHIMLVDLGRNDLGRVCRPGTVKVDDLMFIERYSHVMHIVSQVSGELSDGRTALDVLRAAFPAGTVSGAPKIRAMQIIDELEPTLRGPYAGVFGYISFTGNLDTGITIRTIVVHDGVAHVQAGAGIVADSQPELEYEETLNKAMAMLRAIRMASTA